MGGAVDKLVKDVKMGVKDTWDFATNEVGPFGLNAISKNTGGSGDIYKDVGDAAGVPRNWKEKLMGGPAPAPAAPIAAPEAMPQMDAEAIARARRLAAMKSAGGGRAGTFLGGSGLGNG